MVLTVSFVISLETGLIASITCKTARRLDVSIGTSGPHDFAVRKTRSHPAPTLVTIAMRPSGERGTARIMRVIWGRDQLRQIGTTGKSPGTEKNAVKRNLQPVRGALVSIPSDLMTGGYCLKRVAQPCEARK